MMGCLFVTTSRGVEHHVERRGTSIPYMIWQKQGKESLKSYLLCANNDATEKQRGRENGSIDRTRLGERATRGVGINATVL